ncbi:hypothetical protein MRX96_055935 [Rhipicephalus microplus]
MFGNEPLPVHSRDGMQHRLVSLDAERSAPWLAQKRAPDALFLFASLVSFIGAPFATAEPTGRQSKVSAASLPLLAGVFAGGSGPNKTGKEAPGVSRGAVPFRRRRHVSTSKSSAAVNTAYSESRLALR